MVGSTDASFEPFNQLMLIILSISDGFGKGQIIYPRG